MKRRWALDVNITLTGKRNKSDVVDEDMDHPSVQVPSARLIL